MEAQRILDKFEVDGAHNGCTKTPAGESTVGSHTHQRPNRRTEEVCCGGRGYMNINAYIVREYGRLCVEEQCSF